MLWMTRTTASLSASPVRKASKQVGRAGKLGTPGKLSSREATNKRECSWIRDNIVRSNMGIL